MNIHIIKKKLSANLVVKIQCARVTGNILVFSFGLNLFFFLPSVIFFFFFFFERRFSASVDFEALNINTILYINTNQTIQFRGSNLFSWFFFFIYPTFSSHVFPPFFNLLEIFHLQCREYFIAYLRYNKFSQIITTFIKDYVQIVHLK